MKRKEYHYDIYRYYGRYKETFKEKLLRPDGLKYIILFRKRNATKSRVLRLYYNCRLYYIYRKAFIQIPYVIKIGRGFFMAHNGRVIINTKAVIGNNCSISTGVTIGQENRGKREGAPTIGDSVWIGTNAVIVGNVKIGNNVLIAPLTFVNFDVPDNSIVIGSPGKIIPRADATDGYTINEIKIENRELEK